MGNNEGNETGNLLLPLLVALAAIVVVAGLASIRAATLAGPATESAEFAP